MSSSVKPPSSDPRALPPGYRTLAWMAFMQPVALERRLQACGIDRPDVPLWQLARRGGAESAPLRLYLRRMLVLIGVVTAGLGVASGLLLASFDLPLRRAAQILVAGWALGVLLIWAFKNLRRGARALALGLSVGVIGGAVFALLAKHGVFDPDDLGSARVAVSMLVAVLAGLTSRFALATVKLAAFGAQSLVPRRLFSGIEPHLGHVGVLVGSRLALVLTLGAALGWMLEPRGFVPGTALWISLVLGVILLPRLFIFPLEALLSGLIYAIERFRGVPLLRWSPALYHELSYLPYPWLEQHLVHVADRDPALARRVLDACAVAPGQRAIGRTVLARLQARELEALARRRAFKEVMDLAGPHWLPGLPERAAPELARFSELGRVLADAQGSAPHVKLRHLEQAEKLLRALDHDLGRDGSALGRALRLTLGTWNDVLTYLLPRARREAERTLENPFRTKALDPERGEAEVFRGRSALLRELRSLLIDGEQGATIALLGPRRCGKTSFLKLLPSFIPGALCVYFDPQHNPVASPAGFFSALSARVAEAARDRIDLPLVPPGAPFEDGAAWFRSLETLVGDRRILICIDEVERLEELYVEHARDVERLLGLLRATMQHGNRVRLLLSAKAPFERQGRLWNDHFINAQELWLDHLGDRDALSLLTRPTRDFPADAIPGNVARAVFERTGGQPFLLQAYGSNLVSRLNHEGRRRAQLGDVAKVEARVLELHRTYFANVLDDSPREVQRALSDLAENRPIKLEPATRRELRNRRLITPDDRLRIPVLGTWIREEWPG